MCLLRSPVCFSLSYMVRAQAAISFFNDTVRIVQLAYGIDAEK